MAKVLFYTANKQVLILNMQKLWRQPSKRFSYKNTMIAMINGNPAGAISCLPYSELQQQTFTTVWQIAKIHRLQLKTLQRNVYILNKGTKLSGNLGVIMRKFIRCVK